MAKIAGRKNDGAWFRTNNILQGMSNSEQAALVTSMEADNSWALVTAAYNAVGQVITNLGLDASDWPTSAVLWMVQLIRLGIPLQMWNGVTTYDQYTQRIGPQDQVEYIKILGPFFQKLSVWLRDFLKTYIYLQKELKLLNNKKAPTSAKAKARFDARYAGEDPKFLDLSLYRGQVPLAAKPIAEKKMLTNKRR